MKSYITFLSCTMIRTVGGCSSPFLRSWSRNKWICHTVYDAWSVRRQTYGYLPNRTALLLLLGRYSFPVPMRVGGWVGGPEWLVTYQDSIYTWTITNPSTNRARRRVTSLTWPTTLPQTDTFTTRDISTEKFIGQVASSTSAIVVLTRLLLCSFSHHQVTEEWRDLSSTVHQKRMGAAFHLDLLEERIGNVPQYWTSTFSVSFLFFLLFVCLHIYST